MPSLIPGYEYDIFISYRQKDNRSDQWVTNFVQALREELDATFKEEISIYFDTNPHDGLLETHDVDGSLKEKVKCLVFIPIVSQTYCDPKSFAWQKEFLAFLDFAKNDGNGLDVKLSKGNVAKRVLPVRIHEIDEADKQLFEEQICGVMRPVDFIYKSPGVNRPLKKSDDEIRESGKVLFQDQVNKVANAIKEIVLGVQSPTKSYEKKSIQQADSKQFKPSTTRMIGIAAILLAIASVLGFLIIPEWLESQVQDEPANKSIAVLPFKNMSNDPEQEYFSDGISEELINALAKIKNLKVAGRTSSFSFKDRNEDLRRVGESLGVNTILEGSVRKSGNKIRITAQLVSVEDGFHLWTQTFDRELSDIFKVQDEITAAIINELRVHLSSEEKIATKPADVESYTIYLKARQKLAQRGFYNLVEAKNLFEQALKLDSGYSPAYSGYSKTLSLLNNYSQGDQQFSRTHEDSYKYAARALELDPENAEAYMAIGIAKCWYDWEWEEAERHLLKAIAMNPNEAEMNNFIGDYYRIVADYKSAEKYELRALELDPLHAVNHWDLGETYIFMNDFEKARSYYRSCLKIDPSLIQLVYPTIVNAFRSKGFIYELDSIFNSLDHANYPPTIILQLKSSLAIGKDNLEEARNHFAALEKLGEQGVFSYAYLFDYSFLLGELDKAAYWAGKAVKQRDGLLTYQSFGVLPEFYKNERIAKILSSPELDALYELRRKNLRLNNTKMN